MTRLPLRRHPDPRRVVARLFLPGQEMMGNGESRAAGLRVLIVEPLMVGYMVNEDDRRVIVFSVRYFGPTT